MLEWTGEHEDPKIRYSSYKETPSDLTCDVARTPGNICQLIEQLWWCLPGLI